jgi:methionyl-tRNA synthetase
MHVKPFNEHELEPSYDVLAHDLFPDGVLQTPFQASWFVIPPGDTARRHQHHDYEIFFFVSGRGEVRIGDETSPFGPRDVIAAPPFRPHTITNTSDEAALVLSIAWEEMKVFDRIPIRPPKRHRRRAIVMATPPTPNGDLHAGHLSGPYVAADVYVRYLRMRGAEPRYVMGTDDSQSYTAHKAWQQKIAPAEAAKKYADLMLDSLRLVGVHVDGSVSSSRSPEHVAFVQSVFKTLHAAGAIVDRDAPSPWCDACGIHLYEVYIRGRCPHCDAESGGNACEQCGRPNDCIDLADSRCNRCGAVPSVRTIRRFYFRLSKFTRELRRHVDDATMSPHVRAMCEQMFAAGLPDIALSHVADWGIPVPVPGFESQRIYVWFEMPMLYLGGTGDDWRELWVSDDVDLVQFFGFDNAYFHALLFPPIYLAAEPKIHVPSTYVGNEFLRLDGLKFSTSRNHAIWGHQLVPAYSPDLIRFYLAYCRPETEQTNFTMEEFEAVCDREPRGKWQHWLREMQRRVGEEYGGAVPATGVWTEDHRAFYLDLRRIVAEAATAYEAETFSLQRVTRLACELVRIANRFGTAEETTRGVEQLANERRTAVALECTAAGVLALVAAPLMPEFSSALLEHLAMPALAAWPDTPQWIKAGTHFDPAPWTFFTSGKSAGDARNTGAAAGEGLA